MGDWQRVFHGLPVTPTITSGWHAAREKTTDASTDDRRTSLTPKLWSVFANMSKLKARAGRILYNRQSFMTFHKVAPPDSNVDGLISHRGSDLKVGNMVAMH